MKHVEACCVTAWRLIPTARPLMLSLERDPLDWQRLQPLEFHESLKMKFIEFPRAMLLTFNINRTLNIQLLLANC